MNKFSIILSLFFISFLVNEGWSQCESYSTDNHIACDSFTWIDGVTYTSSNNTAVYTLVGANAAGCDSIVTLNLVLKISSTDANLVTSSDSLICENSNVTLNVSGGS